MSKDNVSQRMELGCKVRKEYGTHSVEFQVMQIFEVESETHMLHIEDILITRLWSMFDEYERQNLKDDLTRPPAQMELKMPPNPKSVATHQQWYKVASIVIDVKDGNKVFKVKTVEAAFKTWGVVCYDEVAEEFNIPELFPNGATKWVVPENARVNVLVDVSGKHKKVIAFEF